MNDEAAREERALALLMLAIYRDRLLHACSAIATRAVGVDDAARVRTIVQAELESACNEARADLVDALGDDGRRS